MALKREVRQGKWIRADGPEGTEFVDAALVGEVPEIDSKVLVPLPDDLRRYCINQEVWSVYRTAGWGARLVCPESQQKTPWFVLHSPESVEKYLAILEPLYEGGMVPLLDLP